MIFGERSRPGARVPDDCIGLKEAAVSMTAQSAIKQRSQQLRRPQVSSGLDDYAGRRKVTFQATAWSRKSGDPGNCSGIEKAVFLDFLLY